MAEHMRAMLELQRRGAVTFDYGNNLRGQAIKAGVADAFEVLGFVPLYIRPLFCEGKGPFRWVALSGDPARTFTATDRAVLETFPENEALCRWIRMAQRARALPGPSRPHLLARVRRARTPRADLQRPGRAAVRSRHRS